jgi:antitoxin HicB
VTYTVVLRAEPEGGYTVLVPALAGCVSFGGDEREALAMGAEAIACHTQALRDTGQPVPEEDLATVLALPVEELTGPITIQRISLGEAAPVA